MGEANQIKTRRKIDEYTDWRDRTFLTLCDARMAIVCSNPDKYPNDRLGRETRRVARLIQKITSYHLIPDAKWPKRIK